MDACLIYFNLDEDEFKNYLQMVIIMVYRNQLNLKSTNFLLDQIHLVFKIAKYIEKCVLLPYFSEPLYRIS